MNWILGIRNRDKHWSASYQVWQLIGHSTGVSNRIPDPKDRTDYQATLHCLFFCFCIRECKVSTFPREKWMLAIPYPPQQFSFQAGRFWVKGRILHLLSQKPFVTNDSCINLVDRCAEIENYCIYITLDADSAHSRQFLAYIL